MLHWEVLRSILFLLFPKKESIAAAGKLRSFNSMWEIFPVFIYSIKALEQILVLHIDWKSILLTPGRESCLLLVSYGNRGVNKKTCAISTCIWGAALGCPSRSCWLCLHRSVHVAKPPPSSLWGGQGGLGVGHVLLHVLWTEGYSVSSHVKKNVCVKNNTGPRAGVQSLARWALQRGGDWNSALPISGFGYACGQEDWIVSGSVLNVACSF